MLSLQKLLKDILRNLKHLLQVEALPLHVPSTLFHGSLRKLNNNNIYSRFILNGTMTA